MATAERARAASALTRYLSEIRTYPSLTREQELDLGDRIARGSTESFHELVVGNLGFVVMIALEYQNMGLPLEDLCNEGNLGLIRAAARYDHRRGIKFITYAAFWIRKSILKALADQAALVRVPEYQRRKQQQQSGRGEWPAGWWPKNASVPLEDATSREGRARLIDVLADHGATDPEREVIRGQDLERLRLGLRCLSAKERAVIAWRFGLLASEVLTLKEIGERLQISRERVRQIEMSARHKLRGVLSSGSRLHRRS